MFFNLPPTKIFILIMVVGIALFISSETANSTADLKTYLNTKYKYSVQYPSGWEIKREQGVKVEESPWVGFRSQKSKTDVLCSINVSQDHPEAMLRQMIAPAISISPYDTYEKALKRGAYKDLILSAKEIDRNGSKGVVLFLKNNHELVAIDDSFTFKGKKAYKVTFKNRGNGIESGWISMAHNKLTYTFSGDVNNQIIRSILESLEFQ